jgi:hypothetical protein
MKIRMTRYASDNALRTAWGAAAAGLMAAGALGCSDQGPGAAAEGELTGTATLDITNAPPDGTCIKVTAAGAQTVTKSFDVAAGASSVLALKGLPVGPVSFSAVAFGMPCSAVAASTVPNWISDPSVTANVVVSPPVAIAITMRHNGRAQVGVNFCQDTQSDSTNCGACGHDCLGGSCVAGVCQPVNLAPAVAPQGVAVDATNVYWTDSTTGQVATCAKSGCNGTPTFLVSNSAQLYPQSIVAEGGTVYYVTYDFSNPGAVFGCGAGGCNNLPTTIAANQAGPIALAADSSNLYWTTQGGQVMQCALGGCSGNPTALATVAGLQPLGIGALAVDATSVYWSDSGGIEKCSIAGCSGAPTTLVAAQQAYGLVTDGTNVYWTDYQNGFVYQCPNTGCAQPTVLASALDHPNNLAVDASNVYWASGDGTINKCDLAGCANGVVTMASGQNGPGRLVLDDTRIYWADYPSLTSGSIMALAK